MTPEQRLEELERRYQRLQRAFTGAMMAIVAIFLIAAAPKPANDVLQTKSLEIVDGDGKVRVRLGPADEGYGLVVYDRDGRFRATLTDAPRGAVMSINKNGGGVKLMALEEGCGLTIRDQNGKPRALVIQQTEGSQIMLKDGNGKTVFSAPR